MSLSRASTKALSAPVPTVAALRRTSGIITTIITTGTGTTGNRGAFVRD